MTKHSSATTSFPPYGHMIREWEVDTESRTQPERWIHRISYDAWLDAMADTLAERLWPRWVIGTGWQGKAAGNMEALTREDFKLFPEFRKMVDPDAAEGEPEHDCYVRLVLEDEETLKIRKDGIEVQVRRGPPAALREVAAGVIAPDDIDKFVDAGFMQGVRKGAGNVDLDLKVLMQRPRAYQMAWILGITDFTHQRAKSALTPSMISGHCFETMMGGIDGRRWLNDKGLWEAGAEMLEQFTVAVGDHRVMGGIHYPSDNISSWLTGLLLCPEIGVTEKEIAWLWRTIQARSPIYKRLKAAAAEPHSPYAEAMTLLQHVGARKIRTVG